MHIDYGSDLKSLCTPSALCAEAQGSKLAHIPG
jgi:hypothetical protein